MNKKILILVIASPFIITSIPLAEASIGWNGFLREIGFGGSQVYESSETTVFPIGTQSSPPVSIRCMDGDWMMNVGLNPSVEITSVDPEGQIVTFSGSVNFIQESGPYPKTVGIDTTLSLQSLQLFDVEATVTILCFNQSPLSNPVGGEWQSSDTVALFIGYSVLNAYWLAPLAIGAGAGMYLTKSKWKKKVE